MVPMLWKDLRAVAETPRTRRDRELERLFQSHTVETLGKLAQR
jgi:hypothetical protein